ncbi:hypothetical protein GW17_00006007 [Ensete ventricosum]|nr:hypothetical protein GW17_00006007 [Ensete ventricosum]
MPMAPGWVWFGVSGASTSGGFSRELLEWVAAKEDLHKGLVGMGVPDMTPPTFNSRSPLLVPPKEDFILIGREIARTLNLISVVTSSVTKSYSESVGAETWREDMTRHAILTAHDGSSIIMASGRFHLGCRCDYDTSVCPNLTRISTWPLS